MNFEINIELLQAKFDGDNVNCSKLESSVKDVRRNFIHEDVHVDGFVLINKRYPIFIFSNTVSCTVTNVLYFEDATIKLHAMSGFTIADSYQDIKLFLDDVADEFILVAVRDEDSFERLLYHLEDYYIDTINNMKMTAEYKGRPDDTSGSMRCSEDELMDALADVDEFLKLDADDNTDDDSDDDSDSEDELNNLQTENNLFII